MISSTYKALRGYENLLNFEGFLKISLFGVDKLDSQVILEYWAKKPAISYEFDSYRHDVGRNLSIEVQVDKNKTYRRDRGCLKISGACAKVLEPSEK